MFENMLVNAFDRKFVSLVTRPNVLLTTSSFQLTLTPALSTCVYIDKNTSGANKACQVFTQRGFITKFEHAAMFKDVCVG